MPFLAPIPGSYAVVSFDPVASYKGLNDPIVDEACQKMSCGKYIACLTQPINMIAMALRYCPYRIDLVVKGLPPDDPDRFFHHAMSLPILPNSLHPMDRRPIQVIPPLPWDGCYHAVHYRAKVRCPMGTSQERPQNYLSLGEAHILDRYLLHDDNHAFAQERARDAGSGASFPPVPEISDELRFATKRPTPNTSTWMPWWLLELPPSMHPGEAASSDSDSESSDTSSAEGSSVTPLGTGEDIHVLESIFGPGKRMDLLPIVRFSYDLTEFDSPPDPSGFFQELSQLKRILADYEARQEQKQAEMLRKDDEYYSRLQAGVPRPKAPTGFRRFLSRARSAHAHDLMFKLREVCRVNPQRLRMLGHVQRGNDRRRYSAPSFADSLARRWLFYV